MLRRVLASVVIRGKVRKPGELVDDEGLDVHDLEHRGHLAPEEPPPPPSEFTLPAAGPVRKKAVRRKKVTARKTPSS